MLHSGIPNLHETSYISKSARNFDRRSVYKETQQFVTYYHGRNNILCGIYDNMSRVQLTHLTSVSRYCGRNTEGHSQLSYRLIVTIHKPDLS
jgi:hypothetical protein